MREVILKAPAKINLMLAVTGRRGDGFHELLSVVAPVSLGDELRFSRDGTRGIVLESDCEELPLDESNLVVRAAKLFQEETGCRGGVRIVLHKRIPIGAGLGGGSSDAVATLRGLTAVWNLEPEPEQLASWAARLGSDCPLFLANAPVVIRGRGERLVPLDPRAAARIRGRRLLVFKPHFAVGTAWAYSRLASSGAFTPPAEAEGRLERWLDSDQPPESLLHNDFEPVVFRKFLALPALRKRLEKEFSLRVFMTGSGAACCCMLDSWAPVAEVKARIREAWGSASFLQETEFI